MNPLWKVVGAAAVGAGLMYVLDPEQGRRRRALLRDKAVHVRHRTAEGVRGRTRDLRNRMRGIAARAGRLWRRGEIAQMRLEERLRASSAAS